MSLGIPGGETRIQKEDQTITTPGILRLRRGEKALEIPYATGAACKLDPPTILVRLEPADDVGKAGK